MRGSNRGLIIREGIIHGGKYPGEKTQGELPGGEVSDHSDYGLINLYGFQES